MSPRPQPIIIPGASGMGGSMSSTQSWQGDPLEALGKILALYHGVVDPQKNAESVKALGGLFPDLFQGQTRTGEEPFTGEGVFPVGSTTPPVLDINKLAESPFGQQFTGQMAIKRLGTMFDPATSMDEYLARQVMSGKMTPEHAFELKNKREKTTEFNAPAALDEFLAYTQGKHGFDYATSGGRMGALQWMGTPEGTKAFDEWKAKGKDRPLSSAQEAAVAARLRGELSKNPYVKDFRDVNSKYGVMLKALDESTKTKNFVAVDQALITLFNKMTDPSSVVRESEYARTPENLSLVNRVKGKVEKIMKGGAGLTDEERVALTDMAGNFYDSYSENYNQAILDHGDLATLEGINPQRVIKTYRPAVPRQKQGGPGVAPKGSVPESGPVDLNQFFRRP